mmetsp:Transcript_158284/g.279359  ORF Transcript_158284/g.279359 Transcript_158284/m.279359 type:complete len:554 (+) Transcript_158284:81-1742(+)
MAVWKCVAVSLLLARSHAGEKNSPSPIRCSQVVVGGGPGGVYAAFRLAEAARTESKGAPPVCLFERSDRLGGRILSLRGMGPKQDLVVEAGAYRFSPKVDCAKWGPKGHEITECEYTPLTAAIVKGALDLPTGLYDPDSQHNSSMEKIVDSQGHSAGYSTFVEEMAQQMVSTGHAKIFFEHELLALREAEDGTKDVLLQLKSPDGLKVARTQSVVLNLPQLPLLRMLGASSSAFSPPPPLFAPMTHAIMKFYVYYEDAWWRNYLNLTAGVFDNAASTEGIGQEYFWGVQFPAPLVGRYFDGDYRCDGEAPRKCRGYLEVAYTGDNAAVEFFRPYVLNRQLPVHILNASHPVSGELLKIVHRSLVELHKDALRSAGKLELVNASLPDSGVLSLWSAEAVGYESGCHFMKSPLAAGTAPGDVPLFRNSSAERGRLLLQPFGASTQIFVANEAFGWPSCWAESSLVMAENAVLRMANLSRPRWLSEAVYKHILFEKSASEVPAQVPADTGIVVSGHDPFLIRTKLKSYADSSADGARSAAFPKGKFSKQAGFETVV